MTAIGGWPGPRIDSHVHLFASSWFTSPVFERLAKTRRRRNAAATISPMFTSPEHQSAAVRAVTAPTAEAQARQLVVEMDAAGIDIACVMAMDFDMSGGKLALPHWEQLVQLADLQKVFPDRFLLFCGIDPRRGKEGVALFERAVKELRCVGLKLLPHWGFYPNDREVCYPLYEKCVEFGVPVTSNCSALPSSHVSRYCHPLLFEEVARDFPEMNICLAHCGAPYWHEYALGLAQAKHNVYVDVGDWQGTDDYSIRRYLQLIRRAMDTTARHKIMFASDWPVFRGTYDEKGWVQLVSTRAPEFGFTFTDEELRLLFTENAQDFLDLDL